MKAFIAFAALIVTVFAESAPEQISEEDDGMKVKSSLVETSPGVYRVEDLVNSEIEASSSSDISYYFYTRQNPNLGFKIASPSDVYVINTVNNSPNFDNKKETLIFIHGWQDYNESDFNYYLRVAALNAYDANVFVVDWHVVSQQNYITARYAVVRLGEGVAEFIQALVDSLRLDLDKLTVAGFSLGAHIAGNAGEVLRGRIGHIVGLDPALPLFNNYYIGDRLDPTDAKFVQIIHTNAGFLGFKISIGHADYYPNGGEKQSGCGLDISRVCSHCRSWEFYAESLASKRFVGRSCESYSQFSRGRCGSNKSAFLGGLYPDYSASGDYYLDTSGEPPFALG